MNIILNYENLEINTKIIISNKKTISIEVTSKAELIVRAGKGYSQKRILEILNEKKDWIIEKVRYIRSKNEEVINRTLENGANLYYLGEKYTLELHNNKTKKEVIDTKSKKITLYNSNRDEECIKDQLKKLYKIYAQSYMSERVNYFSRFFDIKYKSTSIKSQKRIWGSCTKDNKLSFNWKIIMANIDVIDYLIVHEMSHMEFKNHSNDFWNEVARIIPDYKEKRKWLKENGFKLEL